MRRTEYHVPSTTYPSGEGALVPDRGSRLRCCGSVTPGQQFVEPGDLVIGDAAEDVGQPGLGIDAVEFGGLNQG